MSYAAEAAKALASAKPSEQGNYFTDGVYATVLDKLLITRSHKDGKLLMVPEVVVIESEPASPPPSDLLIGHEQPGTVPQPRREGERVTVGAWYLDDMMGKANAVKHVAMLLGLPVEDLTNQDSDTAEQRKAKEEKLTAALLRLTDRSQPERGRLIKVTTKRVKTKKGVVLVIPLCTRMEMTPEELKASREHLEKKYGTH